MAVKVPPAPRPRTTENLLQLEDRTFSVSIGTWTSADAFLSVEYDDIIKDGYNSLKIQPDTLGAVVITLNDIRSSIAHANDKYTFHARLKSSADILVKIDISRGSELTTTKYHALPSDRWTVVRGEPNLIPPSSEIYEYNVKLTITNHGGRPIFLTLPAFVKEFAFTENDFVRECVPLFPSNLTAIDAAQEGPSFPMYRLLDVGLGYANMAFTQFANLRNIDVVGDGTPESGIATLQTLIESLGNNRFVLVWLSQFLGVNLVDPVLGSTPWGNLPKTWGEMMQSVNASPDATAAITNITRSSGTVTADLSSPYAPYFAPGYTVSIAGTMDFNGQYTITGQTVTGMTSSTITWSDPGSDITETDGYATLVDTVWILVEAFNTDLTQLYDYLKWQVAAPYFGRDAGTITALSAATAIGLFGSQSVNVIPNYLGDPWTIKIYTKTSETPIGVEGEPSPFILAAVANAKPAGFRLLHECNEAGNDRIFILGDGIDGILGEDYL